MNQLQFSFSLFILSLPSEVEFAFPAGLAAPGELFGLMS